MGAGVNSRRGETVAHARLKRLALLWAQAHDYSACAFEITLPRCRYRADLAAYRPRPRELGATAIFECKQALVDLRRDNCSTIATRRRLEKVQRRRQILERHLRIHYPNLRIADSLFSEFESLDFAAIKHRGYGRVLREVTALQNRLYDCTKFETLVRYRCANLFFLVLPNELFHASEVPVGWGVLAQADGELMLMRKPVWQESAPENRLWFLQRIAIAGTRALNRQLEITFEDVISSCCQSR